MPKNATMSKSYIMPIVGLLWCIIGSMLIPLGVLYFPDGMPGTALGILFYILGISIILID